VSKILAKSILVLGCMLAGGVACAQSIVLCALPGLQLSAAGLPTPVPMWGYRKVAAPADCATSIASAGNAWAPEAPITIGAGANLQITLVNMLAVPTSLVIPGLALPNDSAGNLLAAVHAEDIVGPSCTPGASNLSSCRIRSFTAEAAPNGGQMVYHFTPRPGTYLYQSGTHQQAQVQMGLYGAMVQSYPGVVSNVQATLLFSEIDPVQHSLIDSVLGAATAAVPSEWQTRKLTTLDYSPTHFLINGKVFDAASTSAADDAATDIPLVVSGGDVIHLRMLNAGYRTRVPSWNARSTASAVMPSHWRVIAEDGQRYAHAAVQHSVELTAGKTSDVLVNLPATLNLATPNRLLAVYDRRFGTDNLDGSALGGAVARLKLTSPGSQLALAAIPDQTAAQDIPFSYQASANGPATYSLLAAPAGMTISPATGQMSWLPGNSAAQRACAPSLVHTVSVQAQSLQGPANATRTFNITVANKNDAPVAQAFAYTATAGVFSVPAAQGLLSVATDPDCDAVAAVPTGTALAGLTLNPDGSFVYAGGPPPLVAQTVSFQYRLNETTTTPALQSNPATVTIARAANIAPVALADSFTTSAANFLLAANTIRLNSPNPNNNPLLSSFNVHANDTDADGAIVPATIVVVPGSLTFRSSPNGTPSAAAGTVQFTAGTGVLSFKPLRTGFLNLLPRVGFYSFSYTVKDDSGASSASNTVTVWVQ
jgi:FtsP/CotA-like multicopper oxidase with cupredoxin domain